jgi:hypothetical protein
MPSITDDIDYVNLSKLSEFNETVPTIAINNFNEVQEGIFGVFALYPILQWFLPIIIFVSLFLILRKIPFLNLTDVQIVALVSFAIMAMNTLLLILNIFTITQPFQLFTIIWLGSVVAIIASKKQ